MPPVSGSIPSIINGVSQQPAALRLLSQNEAVINAYSDPVKGVGKRPPFRNIARLAAGTTLAGAAWHTIDRDDAEAYIVSADASGVSVWDLEGASRVVVAAGGFGYLDCPNPATDLTMLTVADYTFVLNKTKVVAMDATSIEPEDPKRALVYVRQGVYGGKYKIFVDGSLAAQFDAPNGGSASQSEQIATNYIAETLHSSLSLGGTFTTSVHGSTILIEKTDGGDFTIDSSDPAGDDAMRCLKDTVQNFANLPARAVDGFRIKVTGSETTKWSGYYVKFVDDNSNSNTGTWVECNKQGIPISFDAATMPHQLVRQSDGTFTFGPATWIDRLIGDDDSAPLPDFVGRTITDLVFHRNRLGMLSGSVNTLSKSGKFFQFWPDTATQILDSDPISGQANHVKVATLYAAVPFNNELVMFSTKTQFVLAGAQILSPKTATVKPELEFDNQSDICRPLAVGKVLLFTVARGEYTGVHEMQTLPRGNNPVDAPEITAAVPKYLPGGIFKMAASTSCNTAVALSDQVRNKVWVYKYFWEGDEKRQSAWSHWEFPETDTILNMDFVTNVLYSVVQRGDGTYLEAAHLDLGKVDAPFNFQVHLDRLILDDGVYDEDTETTLWALPYPEAGTLQVVTGEDFDAPGVVITHTRPTDQTITAEGDYSGRRVYIGRPYRAGIHLSPVFAREPVKGNPAATVAIQDARLQLNRMRVTYDKTGYFRAEVTPDARDLAAYTFNGRILGTNTNIIGQVAMDLTKDSAGSFAFPVLTRNTTVKIELVNDTFLPSTFQNLEWEGKLFIRSQRV